ncbi:hypothetical protein NT6N_16080 [Oceaniferula spumae]|uniref:Uncharacterized protein n=1 Tax=Oceaniferula spumae TaxID=2979115 RepID=A0AAT9FKU7_9BACT
MTQTQKFLTTIAIACFSASFTAHAENYVERIAVVDAKPQLIDSLSDTVGNFYQIKSVTREDLAAGKGLTHTEQLLVRVDSKTDLKATVTDARKLPHLNRINLLPDPTTDETTLTKMAALVAGLNQAPAEKPEKPAAAVILHDPRSPDASAGEGEIEALVRLGRNALIIPRTTPGLSSELKRFGKDTVAKPYGTGHQRITSADTGLEIIEPRHPRAGGHWFLIDAPAGLDNEALKPWVALLLERGYYLVNLNFPSNITADPEKLTDQLKRVFGMLRGSKLSNSPGMLTAGADTESALALAALAPKAWHRHQFDWHQLIVVDPPAKLSDDWEALENSLISLRTKHKSLTFVSDDFVDPDPANWLWRARVTWEQSFSTFSHVGTPSNSMDFLIIADLILRDGNSMARPMEVYAHRPDINPAFTRVSPEETLKRFRASGEGTQLGKLNPNPPSKKKFFPEKFEETQNFWRKEMNLKRNADGSVTGHPLFVSIPKDHPERASTIAHAIHSLHSLCSAWRESARTAEDRAAIEPLIRDLAAHCAESLRIESHNSGAMNSLFRQRKKLGGPCASISKSAHLMAPEDTEELGRFILVGLKDRWEIEPYQNMDVFRYSANAAGGLNLFQDDDTLYRHLLERADYADRVFRLSSGISQEGGPRHHGLMHYSYASYSYWAIDRFIQHSLSLGLYLSRESYDRIERLGILSTSLGMPRYYKNIVPLNANARTGTPLGAGSAEKALNTTAKLGEGDKPGNWNLKSLAQLDWTINNSKVAAEAKKEGVDWSSVHPRRQRTVNTATLALRQFDELQACAVGLSRSLGSWVEVYFQKAGEGYALYHKAGSLYLRAPGEQRAERYIVNKGYNHTFTPGTTSEPRTGQSLKLRGGNGKITNNNGAGGGTHLPPVDANTPATDGMLAVDLDRGPAPGCYKSYFFFGDRITSLTSNIERFSNDAKHVKGHAFIQILKDEDRVGKPILTTLFQWPLDATKEEAEKRTAKDSKQLPVPFLDDTESNQKIDNYLVRNDQFGNAWVVHPVKDAVFHYRRGTQEYDFTGDDNTGRWEKSWIVHNKPDGTDAASLIYSIIPRTAKKDALTDPKALVKSLQSDTPAYSVWRCDPVAHILRDTASKATGYAIFHPTTNPAHDTYLPHTVEPDPNGKAVELTDKGDLISSSSPSFVMIREEADGARALSYFNPHPMKVRRVILTLRGAWKLDSAYAESDPDTLCETLINPDGTTQVHFLAGPKMRNDGNDNRLPVMIRLVPAK